MQNRRAPGAHGITAEATSEPRHRLRDAQGHPTSFCSTAFSRRQAGALSQEDSALGSQGQTWCWHDALPPFNRPSQIEPQAPQSVGRADGYHVGFWVVRAPFSGSENTCADPPTVGVTLVHPPYPQLAPEFRKDQTTRTPRTVCQNSPNEKVQGQAGSISRMVCRLTHFFQRNRNLISRSMSTPAENMGVPSLVGPWDLHSSTFPPQETITRTANHGPTLFIRLQGYKCRNDQ